MGSFTTGAKFPGTSANDNTVGTQTWANVGSPGNTGANDASVCRVELNAQTSQYLKMTNYGFSVPTGATITGIKVTIELDDGAGGVTGCIDDSSVRLTRSSTFVGDNKARSALCRIDGNSTIIYGGAGDLWGTTWTVSQINDSTFGIGYSGAETDGVGEGIEIDYATIEVFYTIDGQLNFENNFGLEYGMTMPVNVASLTFFPFNFRSSISFNTLNMIPVAAGQARTITISMGLYSLSGSTLSLANSVSGSKAMTQVAADYGYWMSMATSATQNITPGTWWFGILATTSGAAISLVGQSTRLSAGNAFPGGFIGGAMTDSTNALPSSYETSNLNITGQSAFPVPYLIISA